MRIIQKTVDLSFMPIKKYKFKSVDSTRLNIYFKSTETYWDDRV